MVLAGCENGVQEIEGNVGINDNKAPQVGAVTVTKTTNNQYYIVSWDAVAEDVSYSLYFQQDGKKSSSSISGAYGQNRYKYDPATGEEIANDDFDKWSYRVEGLSTSTPGAYRFGVRTSFSSSGVTRISSDVKWSEAITVTAGPRVASVNAVKTTGGYNNYIIVSWNAVTGAAGYRVFIEQDGVVDEYGRDGQNYYTYSTTDGSESTNSDLSKWSYRLPTYYYGNGTYRFKVEAQPSTADISVIPSAGVWSSPVSVNE
jgi:hypothetical protein